MPNVNDMNDFVTAGEDVKEGDEIEFLDGGSVAVLGTGADAHDVIQMKVKLPNGKEKKLSLNRTSMKNLSALYGSETESWQGKTAICTVISQNVKGTIRKVLYLMPVKQV